MWALEAGPRDIDDMFAKSTLPATHKQELSQAIAQDRPADLKVRRGKRPLNCYE